MFVLLPRAVPARRVLLAGEIPPVQRSVGELGALAGRRRFAA
jgi:hypothetical protein